MPIRGMTDKQSITPRFPRLGKLRKGGERIEKVNKDGKKYTTWGEDLNHFRFTSPNPDIVTAFEEVYGKEPKSIMVYLPYATPDECFPTWCELWGESGLVHRCDGENMTIWLEGDHYVKGSKPCVGGHKNNNPLDDGIGRLSVIIPELVQAGFVGFVTVETHSKNDIVSISSVLAEALQQRGDNPLGLRGIQFQLRRIQENISVPGWGDRKGKRSRTDKWLVRLEPAVEWVRLQLTLDRQRAMLLPSGNGEETPVEETAADLPDDLTDTDEIPDGEYKEAAAEADIPEFSDPAPTQTEVVPEVVKAAMEREIVKTGGETMKLGKLTFDEMAAVLKFYDKPNLPEPKLKLVADVILVRDYLKEHPLAA